MRLLPLAAMLLAVTALSAAAQGTTVPFGSKHDASQPVEITSDALQLDQEGGTALFTGKVRVGQGQMRLAADQLKVFYIEGADGARGQVDRMEARGNVTLSNGTEAAEGQSADYAVATGLVDMSGDVLLTQGQNALSSDKLHIDLNGGTAQLDGRVRTIFTPGTTPARSGQ